MTASPIRVAQIATGNVGVPALNAIKAVVDAPSGMVTRADLPLRGFAGRFKR